jgi:nucleoside phosphorylase
MLRLSNRLTGRDGQHANVALLTTTIEEFDVVRRVFSLNQELVGTPYAVETIKRNGDYPIVLRRAAGQTNVLSSELTSEVLEDFRPNYLLLIGTAGGHSGRDDLKLGDVVVADYIDYSGYWKLKDGQYFERKNACDHPSLHLREKFAEALRRSPQDWLSELKTVSPDGKVPAVLTGALVAGDMLLGDSDNAEQRRILECYGKALAFEMESFGVRAGAKIDHVAPR